MDYLLNKDKENHLPFLIIQVLNLIINGLSSKPNHKITEDQLEDRFKPYYKWTIF